MIKDNSQFHSQEYLIYCESNNAVLRLGFRIFPGFSQVDIFASSSFLYNVVIVLKVVKHRLGVKRVLEKIYFIQKWKIREAD